jgi:hypothetical protein
MKKILLISLIAISLFAQMPSAAYYYLDIDTDFSKRLPNENPAYLSVDNIPYAYAFKYGYDNEGGDYKRPFMPSAKHYHNLEVSAYQTMENGLLFAGRFEYRNEIRKDKLWLHNAETHMDVPFYFADSTSGDFNLNGIDWNIIFSYPLSKVTRVAVDLFYNVDEQFKSVFPKPNIKRNDYHIRPAISFNGKTSSAGLYGSFFQFRENIETKKYSLEQGKSPTFMRIRGLDKPLLTYAETSEERLQTITGYGVSGNADLGGHLLFDVNYETSSADIVDGGSYPVPQGTWDANRFNWRVDLKTMASRHVDIDMYFQQYWKNAKGYHPDLNAMIYQVGNRQFEGGVLVPFTPISGETWTNYVSYAFEDIQREDNFLGLSHYIPWSTLSLGANYELIRRGVDYILTFGYSKITVGDKTVYNDDADWYYHMITAKEIEYYTTDREVTEAGAKIIFPYKNMKIALIGTYKEVKPINTDALYHEANASFEIMF